MAIFIDLGLAYSPLNSAKLSCSSEVTLLQTYHAQFQSDLKGEIESMV